MPQHSPQNNDILIYLLWSQQNKTLHNATEFSCLFLTILTHIDIQLLCRSDSHRADQVDLSSESPIYKFSYWQSKKQKSRAKLHCITALHKPRDDIAEPEKHCFHFVQCQKCLPRCRGFHRSCWGIHTWRALHLFPPPLIPPRSTLTQIHTRIALSSLSDLYAALVHEGTDPYFACMFSSYNWFSFEFAFCSALFVSKLTNVSCMFSFLGGTAGNRIKHYEERFTVFMINCNWYACISRSK